MPELPEVQTIVSDLQILTGDTITGFWSDFEKALKTTGFAKEIIGKKIISVQRLGKIILLKLNDNKSIAVHLKMTGQLLLNFQFSIFNFQTISNDSISKQKAQSILKQNKHIHHVFLLKNSGIIAFSDVRKFATISLLSEADIKKIRESYGVDPIDDVFSSKDLTLIVEKRKNKPIKQILMDNSVILGIGNIYASEILFTSRISPLRKGETLTEIEIKKLHISIKKILTKAIQLRGTSVSDYRDSKGEMGSFQNELKVYKKHGQKCNNCDTMIERVVIGQRSTFYCPKCQH